MKVCAMIQLVVELQRLPWLYSPILDRQAMLQPHLQGRFFMGNFCLDSNREFCRVRIATPNRVCNPGARLFVFFFLFQRYIARDIELTTKL